MTHFQLDLEANYERPKSAERVIFGLYVSVNKCALATKPLT